MGRHKRPSLVAMLGCLLLLGAPPPSLAATNSAYGGIRGLNNGTLLGGDGTGTAQFTIESHRLALIKQARDAEGTLLPAGANVDAGSEIYFLLIVENPTTAPAPDIRLADSIHRDQFVYIEGSLEISVSPIGTDNLWSTAWTPVTDAVGAAGPDDQASATTIVDDNLDRVTLGADLSQPNLRFDLEAGHRLALRFRARVE